MAVDRPDRARAEPPRRSRRPRERVALVLALATLVVGTAATIANHQSELRVASVVVSVVVLCSILLRRTQMIAVTVAAIAAMTVAYSVDRTLPTISGIVTLLIVFAVAIVQATRRDSLGLRDVSAERVLTQIRDRLDVQAAAPHLPPGWELTFEQRPADGAALCGDFVASRVVEEDGTSVLHLVVVDVSGSGITAGPRTLLLSGAVGGLLGSVPPEDFLPAANDYLLRQQWSLGFASAAYITLDLVSGTYTVRLAGHLAPMVFRPDGPQRWHICAGQGTVLGVTPNVGAVAERGQLGPGDSLFVFTDGVVETRGHDVDRGTELLRAAVEVLVAGGDYQGLAGALIDRGTAARTDDRTIVHLRRRAVRSALEEEEPCPDVRTTATTPIHPSG